MRAPTTTALVLFWLTIVISFLPALSAPINHPSSGRRAISSVHDDAASPIPEPVNPVVDAVTAPAPVTPPYAQGGLRYARPIFARDFVLHESLVARAVPDSSPLQPRGIKEFFQNIGNKIKSGFQSFGQKVKGAFQKAGHAIKKGFQDFGHKVKTGFQKAGQAIKKGFQKVGHAFHKAGQAIKKGFQKVGHAFQKAGHAIKKGFQDFGHKVKTGFQKAGQAIKKGFQKVGHAFHKAGQAIKSGFQTAGRKIKEGFQTAGRKMKEGFQKAGQWIKENGAKVAKFGLKILATAASVGSKIAKFIPIPGLRDIASKALQAESKIADIGANAIKADLGDKLDKGFQIMDKIQHPISGAGGAILDALRKRDAELQERDSFDLEERSWEDYKELFARDLDGFELEERDLADEPELVARTFEEYPSLCVRFTKDI